VSPGCFGYIPKDELKQCELALDVCQKYLIQNKRFRDWAQSLVKNNVLPGSVLQDFETLPSGFISLLEDRIKYIKETGDEGSTVESSSKSESKTSDKEHKKKIKKSKDKKKDKDHHDHPHDHHDKEKEHRETPSKAIETHTPKSSGIHVPEHKGDFDLFAPVAQPSQANSFDPFGPSSTAFNAPSSGPTSVFAPAPVFSSATPTNVFPSSNAFVVSSPNAFASNTAPIQSPFPSPQPTPFDVFNMPVATSKPQPTVNAVDVFFQKPAAQTNKGPPKPRDPFAAINQPQTRTAGGNPFTPNTSSSAARDPFASIDFLSTPQQQQQQQSASLSDLASNPFFANPTPKPAASQSNPFDPF